MRVQLIKNDRIRSLNIPDVPSGNFWVTDYDESGKEVNLLNITEENGVWKLISNQEFYCELNSVYVAAAELKNYTFYTIKKLLLMNQCLFISLPLVMILHAIIILVLMM